MRRHLYDQCVEFTRKCQADPLFALLFVAPAENALSEEGKAEYRQLIPRPMDLATISANLRQEAPHYKTAQQWADDFALIFANAIRYDAHVGATWITGVAQHYAQKLRRFAAGLTVASDADYAGRLGAAYARYLEVLGRPPAALAGAAAAAPRPLEDCDGPFEEHALALLAKRLNKLLEEGVDGVAAEALALLPPDAAAGDGELCVDLGALPAQARKALWELVRRKERELDA
jgi:hypothetical protein